MKHKVTEHDESEWKLALQNARESLKPSTTDDKTLEQFALASGSPAQLTLVVRLIYLYGKSHPEGESISKTLLRFANDSPFSLSDWLNSIEYFYKWLTERNRKIDFLHMLKYLECCVAAPDAKEAGSTLTALVAEMLQVMGYEGV